MAQASIPSITRASHSGDPALLRANSIRKTYRMGEEDIVVLKQVDLTLKEGEFVAIEGRSGSGKSTLLHIMGGLDSPDSGSLEFEETDYTPRLQKPTDRSYGFSVSSTVMESILVAAVTAMMLVFVDFLATSSAMSIVGRSPIAILRSVLEGVGAGFMGFAYFGAKSHIRESPICRVRNTKFGFVFQFYHLLPELNVVENTLLPIMIEKSWWSYMLHKGQYVTRAKALLTELGLGHRLRHKPNQLSGGERQRVAIARALMNNPKVLFADEPTGNLDYETGRQIMGVLETLHREKGQTIVMVTHDRSLASHADRVLVLQGGRLEKAEAKVRNDA